MLMNNPACPKCGRTTSKAMLNGKPCFYCCYCNHAVEEKKKECGKEPTHNPNSTVRGAQGQRKGYSKYGSRWHEYEGHKFQSGKELRLWKELQMREVAGDIFCLRRQTRFPLRGLNGGIIGHYRPDYTWWEDRGSVFVFVIADCKSDATKTESYGLRKKLVKDNYGVSILEM